MVLPAGTYLATASRGPEYSIDTRVIEVVGGERRELAFSIDRTVDTRGLASLDPHMHTRNSDGYVTIGERLRSLVAEGVDVAVGVVETHGRAETEALLLGLPVIPRQKIEYRGVTLQEMDIGSVSRAGIT